MVCVRRRISTHRPQSLPTRLLGLGLVTPQTPLSALYNHWYKDCQLTWAPPCTDLTRMGTENGEFTLALGPPVRRRRRWFVAA